MSNLALLLLCVLVYGAIAGTLITIGARRFFNPTPGRRRHPEDML